MEPGVEVRLATLDDTTGLIYVQATTWIKSLPNETYGITEEDIRSVNFAAKNIEWQHLLESSSYKVWVAASNREIRGYVVAYRTAVVHELYALYVLPEYQRKGIGAELYGVAEAWLGEEKPIVLHAAVYNHQALNFWSKRGFLLRSRQAGVVRLPNGKVIPTIEMRKDKDEPYQAPDTPEVESVDSQGDTLPAEQAIEPVEPAENVYNVDTGYSENEYSQLSRSEYAPGTYSSGGYAAEPEDSNSDMVGRSELAKASGERSSTIKYYTEIGLMPFEQASDGMKRYYRLDQALSRLDEINKLKADGLTIEEIKNQLSA